MKKKLIKRYIEKGLLDNDFEWNDGYYLEGMDRIHTIHVMIEELLNKHPMIVLSGGQKVIDDIQNKLSSVYQFIGAMEYEESQKRP